MSRTTLQDLIQDNFPDNTTKFITPELARELYDAMVLETFVKTSDDAEDVPYAPSTPLDWNAPEPEEVQAGLDQLGGRVRILENAPATVYTIQLYAHTDSTVSNIFPIFGKANLIGTTENKSTKDASVSYETSVNGGDTWVAHANYTTLQTNLTAITMPGDTFVFVRGIFTFLGGFVGEQVITLNYTNF